MRRKVIDEMKLIYKFDLIVMSTRGHSGLSRWLLGSVANRVARGATAPLLLVQARSDAPS